MSVLTGIAIAVVIVTLTHYIKKLMFGLARKPDKRY